MGSSLAWASPCPWVTLSCAVPCHCAADVSGRPCLARLGQEAGWVAPLAVRGGRAWDLGTCSPGTDCHPPVELPWGGGQVVSEPWASLCYLL